MVKQLLMIDHRSEQKIEEAVELHWLYGADLMPCTVGPSRRPSFLRIFDLLERYPHWRGIWRENA